MFQSKAVRITGGIALFLFFVLLTFPYQNLSGLLFGRLYKETRILIVPQDMGPTFLGWPGLVLTNVNVSLPLGNGDVDLRAERVVVRVGLGSIFPPAPSLSLSMSRLKGGGDLYVRLVPGRSRVRAVVEAEKVDLKQARIPGLPEPIPGILDMDADVTIDRTDATKSNGEAALSVAGLRVPALNLQGIVLPVLKMGDIKAKIAIRNGSAEITQFQIGNKDSDISGTAVGDLKLAPNLMMSFLNLTLRLQLTEKYRKDPQSATVVSFFDTFRGAEPGVYGMKWNATLQDMTTNMMAAIPQKAQ
jgi:type II secretion system protein N